MTGKFELTPKARALGVELRDCRVAAGLTQQELAKKIGVSHVTISRYETGTRCPKAEDVAQILATLGVVGERYTGLVEMAKGAEEPNWLETCSVGLRRELNTLIEFERTATSVVEASLTVIPGLLQTADFVRAIMAEGDFQDVETRIAIRMGRQAVLQQAKPLAFTGIVFDFALRHQIGGPEVAVDQLRNLQKMLELPNVDLLVLPAVAMRWHPALSGAFVLFEFANGKPIVHIEHYRTGAFVYTKEVEDYRQAVETFREMAFGPAETAALIAEAIEDTEVSARR